MATKYVDISATYNGDGTLSTQATSDGGVGAWNIFKSAIIGLPAYGSISPGDDIYVRTADGLGNLIETTPTITTVLTGLSNDSPLRVFFDDGVIWPHSGLFTYNITEAVKFKIITNFHLIGVKNNFKILYSKDSNLINLVSYDNCFIHFINIEKNTASTNRAISTLVNSSRSPNILGVKYKATGSYNNSAYPGFKFNQYSGSKIIGLQIDYSVIPTTRKNYCLANASYGENTIRGLEVIGDSANTYAYYNTSLYPHLNEVTHIKSQNNLMHKDKSSSGGLNMSNYSQTILTYEDSGFYESRTLAIAEWYPNENYPVLTATLLDDTSKWSVRMNNSAVNKGMMGATPIIEAIISQTDGIRTITMELLINDNITSPTTLDFFMIVTYTDTNGNIQQERTLNIHEPTLTTSTASWDTTTYNSQSHSKYKIQLTTQNQVKQKSNISAEIVTFRNTLSGVYWFFNPELNIT